MNNGLKFYEVLGACYPANWFESGKPALVHAVKGQSPLCNKVKASSLTFDEATGLTEKDVTCPTCLAKLKRL